MPTLFDLDTAALIKGLLVNDDKIRAERSALIDRILSFETAAQQAFQEEGVRARERAPELAERADYAQQLVNVLQVEREIASNPLPADDSTSSGISGRITALDYRGVANVQVALIDKTGAPVKGATATTDESGGYVINLAPEVAKSLKGQNLSVKVGEGTAAFVPAAAQPVTVTPGTVTLTETALKPREQTTALGTAIRASTPQPARAVTTSKAVRATSSAKAAKSRAGKTTTRRRPVK